MRASSFWQAAGCTLLLIAGCTTPGQTELERLNDRVFVDVIGPAITKAMEETTARTAALQGGVQGIEPGYEVVFDGIIGTSIRGKATVRIVGIAGQLTGGTQADEGP
jgi:hypothetical protein